ncbi:Spy/CpxP family protein refolding chaperone [Acidobacteriota bacterium]
MDIFSKKYFMTWAIVILVILNMIALGTIYFSRIQRPRPMHPPEEGQGPESIHFFLKQELNLSEGQMDQFKRMGDEHRRQTQPLQDRIHRLKKDMMGEMFSPTLGEEEMDRIAEEIGRLEAQIQKALFSHFKDFASICDTEQRQKFEVLINDVLDLSRPPAPEGPPGPDRKRPPPKKRNGVGPRY